MLVTSTPPTETTQQSVRRTDSALDTHVANEGVLELANGRILGYAEYGPADGTPLLFCHGSPGSRYQRHPEASLLETHGIRQITIERPGYGNSTYQPGRTLLDWPNDIAEAADVLDLPEFFLVGLSGGGPHVLACAARIPERLLGVAILDSPGPVAESEAAAVLPVGLRLAVKLIPLRGVSRLIGYTQARAIRKDPDAFMDSLGERWGEVDLEVFRRPSVREMFREDFTEAVRPGSKGLTRDLRIGLRDWGFELAQIEMHVDVWHGEQDGSAPVELARYVVAELPDATGHYRADAGHLLIFDYWDEILSTLARRVERSGAGISNR